MHTSCTVGEVTLIQYKVLQIVCVYVCMYVCMYIRMYIHVYVYMCVCVCVCVFVCVCVCVCVYVYVCMYVCTVESPNKGHFGTVFKSNICLIIRSSSKQDIVIHVQYYSKPNRDWELVCVKQRFVLRLFLLTRFYCKVLILMDTLRV